MMAGVTDTQTLRAPAARPAIGRASPLRVARVIWLREILVYTRDRARLISALIMPLLMLLIFGEGFGRTIGTLEEGINYRQFIFPGVVAMTVLMQSVFSGVSIIWDREFGFLREMLVAPISRSAIGVGKLLGGSTIAVAQGVLMFVFAPILGVNLSLLVIVQLIGVLYLLSLTMTSVGIFIASRMRSVEGFQMVTQLTIMPSMFLSGIFFPVNNLPGWMEVLVKINPVTYAVAPIRRIALDSELVTSGGQGGVVNIELFGHVLSTFESLGVLAAFGVVMLSLAIYSFRNRA
jgi:ABC-2 type transport system permease protein